MLNLKKLSMLILALATFGLLPLYTQAQETDVSPQEFERLIENAFKVDFRTYVIEQLGLNEDEITRFTPIYLAYMDERADLADERQQLMEEYANEMRESNNNNEKEETADFIENYWEVNINEMELRKDYFDRMEDAISYKDAMAFFLLEEDLSRSLNRVQMQRLVPAVTIIDLPENGMSDNNSSYIDFNIDGKVALDHHFTHQGLTQLVSAADAIARAKNINIPQWEQQKQQILHAADQITQHWRSTDHADKTREAFLMTANVFQTLQQRGNFTALSYEASQLADAARRIDPSVNMTQQSEKVRDYFLRAESLVNTMANRADLDGLSSR